MICLFIYLYTLIRRYTVHTIIVEQKRRIRLTFSLALLAVDDCLVHEPLSGIIIQVAAAAHAASAQRAAPVALRSGLQPNAGVVERRRHLSQSSSSPPSMQTEHTESPSSSLHFSFTLITLPFLFLLAAAAPTSSRLMSSTKHSDRDLPSSMKYRTKN